MSSVSKASSLTFALPRPDPGQLALDERVRSMTPSERAEEAHRLSQKAFVLVHQAADAAGPMSELDRAIFILHRLYPEFSDAQLADMRADLARRQAAGTWHGFERPRVATEGGQWLTSSSSTA